MLDRIFRTCRYYLCDSTLRIQVGGTTVHVIACVGFRCERITRSMGPRRRRCKWYGQVLRMPPCRLPKHAISWTPNGRRKLGTPEDTWRRTIAWETREQNIDQENVLKLAEDRSPWRTFVADLWTT